MEYSISTNPNLLGKNPALLAGFWRTVSTSIRDLVSFSYVGGRAIAAGLYDASPLQVGEKTNRLHTRWLGSEMVVIDIDGVEGWTLERVLALPCVASAAAVFPSSSYSPDTLKIHIIYALNQRITDVERYRQVGAHLAEQFPFTVDPSTTRNPTQAVYGTVFTHPTMQNHRKALDDNLCWINPVPVTVSVPAILAERIASGKYAPNGTTTSQAQHSTPDAGDADLSKRVEAHLEAPPAKRLSVTLDALTWALKGDWGSRSREERLPLLMAAHAAYNDPAVRDMFLTHSAPRWNASHQKATLSTWWHSHQPREGGYSVLTLFFEARRNGWLSTSSVALSNYEEIYAPEVGDWLVSVDLPTRLLLKSPTGSGKTVGTIQYFKHINAKRAVLFAPSIKLCITLSRSLTAHGVENTLYIESDNKTKDAQTLREANVLVTTLQTFGVKVLSGGVDVSSYDLVVMDESDEMFSAFVRSGIGGKLAHPSHVNAEQARFGVDTLTQVFQKAGRVLLLDGTATDLSRYMLERLSPQGTTGVYVNTFSRDKAPVTMYTQLNGLRNDIVTEVSTGKRVVVACDTKAEAALMETVLRVADVCPPEQILRITGDTAADKRVHAFFSDVEAGASQYQVIIYNSAMGSGVSIVHTQPDVVYLIATYLAPDKLLQMVNRYRRQTEVRAYVAPRESLYSESVDERYMRLREIIRMEGDLAGLQALPRNETAKIVAQAALIAATHDYDQQRSVRDYFTRLLREDGRAVTHLHTDTDSLKEEVKQARELLKQRRADVMQGWRFVAPIERGQALPKDITTEDAAKGLLHGLIVNEFGAGFASRGLEDAEIADLALRFKPHKWLIDRWLNPEKIMNNTAVDLQNSRRETVTFRLYFSRIELLTLVALLVPDWSKEYTDDELAPRANTFIREVSKRRPVYDMVASSHLSYEDVLASSTDDLDTAKRFASAILKSVGLQFKRKNGKRGADGETRERVSYVDGRDRLTQYLALRGLGDTERLATFNRGAFSDSAERAKAISQQYMKLDAASKREVLTSVAVLDDVTFQQAVQLQYANGFAN